MPFGKLCLLRFGFSGHNQRPERGGLAMQMEQKEMHSNQNSKKSNSKKVYVQPRLIVYGNAKEITKGGGGATNEAGKSMA